MSVSCVHSDTCGSNPLPWGQGHTYDHVGQLHQPWLKIPGEPRVVTLGNHGLTARTQGASWEWAVAHHESKPCLVTAACPGC